MSRQAMDPWHSLVHRLSTTQALLKRVQQTGCWKRKIGPWMSGKPVDDAPERNGRGHDAAVSVTEHELLFIGPFAEVSATKVSDGWLAKVERCANTVQEHYRDEDKLASDFAGSVWHKAIRGVI